MMTVKEKKKFTQEDELKIIQTLPSIPRIGVFLTTNLRKTPHCFEEAMIHIGAITDKVIFLKIERVAKPYVLNSHVAVKSVDSNIACVSFSYGWMEHVGEEFFRRDLSIALNQLHFDDTDITIFASAEIIQVVNKNPLWMVLLTIYSYMKQIFYGTKNIQLPSSTIYVTSIVLL